MATHYAILNVSHEASFECIKKAYRQIQLQNHPDKTKHLPEPQRACREITSKAANVAYEVLTNPESRAIYDNKLSRKCTASRSTSSTSSTFVRSFTSSTFAQPSENGSNPSEGPQRPSYKHFRTSKRFPTSLRATKGAWRFSIEIEGRYEPYDWGNHTVFQEGDQVTIRMSIRARAKAPADIPDVFIHVMSTPGGRSVTKIELLAKTTGGMAHLTVTIFSHPGCESDIYKKGQSSRLNNSLASHFSWNLESQILRGEVVWGKAKFSRW